MTLVKKFLLRGLGASLLLYVLLAAALVVNQRSFIYLPFPGAITPEDARLENYARHQTTTADGTPIIYWESTGNESAPTLLYFHGNAGGLHMFTGPLDYLNKHDFHVIAIEYRGYPDAPSGASQTAIVSDGVALYDFVKKTRPHHPIVMWGWSLGSGIATQVAAKRNPTALVLEAPFTGVVDRAGEMFPMLPVNYLMRDTYLSRVAIKDVHSPLFIMHGEDDITIPVHHGKALFAAANEPKILRTYPHFGHENLMDSPGFPEAVAFLKSRAKP